MLVREVECKSILSRSRIYGVDYSVNPYSGCSHGCKYCYARSMPRRIGADMEWGEFVFVKVNAARVLSRELRRAKRGLVLLSSTTDPYQPVEERYEITRALLKVLASKDFPVVVLTKSPLVLRDIDILERFSEVEVGLTVVTLDEDARKAFEPGAPPVEDRLRALRELKRRGVPTYAFLGPLLPLISEADLRELFREFKRAGVGRVVVDKLSVRKGLLESLREAVRDWRPELAREFFRRALDTSYPELLRRIVSEIAEREGLRVDFCY